MKIEIKKKFDIKRFKSRLDLGPNLTYHMMQWRHNWSLTFATGHGTVWPAGEVPGKLRFAGVCGVFLGDGVLKLHTWVVGLHQQLWVGRQG